MTKQCIFLLLLSLCSYLFADTTVNHQETIHQVAPAVVGIRTVVIDKSSDPNNKQKTLHYYGTGVFISKDGFLLTNMTVVPQAPLKTTLFLMDGRVVSASCLGIYPKTETVLLKAEGDHFPYLELSDSRDVEVGDLAYTLGNPFHSIENDEQVAVAKGSISGIYKISDNVEKESNYQDLVLETNAALNPGSDGGPLVDGHGCLVGIMSLAMQKERRMGTAIPSHLIVEDIKEIRSFSFKSHESEISTPEQIIAQKVKSNVDAIVAIEVKRTQQKLKNSTANSKKNTREQIMRRPDSWGSGIVIEEGNYVLTSALHVQNAVNSKAVTLYIKNKKVQAEIIATHLPYDIALLKPQKKIKTASFSIEHQPDLVLGNWVAVCGRIKSSSDITFDSGIISAVNRNVNLVNVYQTQAFINYANSGGPVLNIDGNLVGIAGHISPQSSWGLNSGISMFTSITTVRAILAKMKQGKSTFYPELPFLGVSFWQEKKIPQGALIATVTIESAAHKAGLLPGDILISLDDTLVGEWADLVRVITSKKIGQDVKFEIMRNEKKMELKAKLGKRSW